MDIKKNLELKNISVKKENVSIEASNEALQAEIQKLSNGALIAWQVNRIVWGKITNGTLELSDGQPIDVDLIQEIRIFNDQQELHLVKLGKSLKGRWLTDGEGDSVSVVDSIAPMWGKSTESGAFSQLADDDRKLYMKVAGEIQKGKRCGLITRNYVTSDAENGLAGYTDYRFMGLQPLEV